MMVKQTKSFIRLSLSGINEVLEKMPKGEEKLRKSAELLESPLD